MERNGGFRPVVIVCALVIALCGLARAQYAGGAGTANDPYQIASAQDLIDLGSTPDDYDKHFILTADIDLSGVAFDRAVIAGSPVTESRDSRGTPFVGVFAGNSHVIRHLSIEGRSHPEIEGRSYLGLFGEIATNALVRDLGLENISIRSIGDCAGGLAGRNAGALANCYSTGQIVGEGHRIGGLVGVNCGSMLNCYSTAEVTGNNAIGGLVGYNEGGDVSNCYCSGVVVGTEAIGGLIGDRYRGSVVNSLWDTETSGLTISAGGMGLTTAEMKDEDIYQDAGWDFLDETANGTAETWQMPQTEGYPVLSLFEGYEPVLPEGQGTIAEPFLIGNIQELGSIGYRPLASYRLEADMDLSGMIWSVAVIPWFDGQFDGNGRMIRDLDIQGGGLLGLFGHLGDNSVVTDLGLENASVRGTSRFIGVLAGRSRGRLANCHSTGSAAGDEAVGGLVGENHTGSLLNCHSAGTVTGEKTVGGLVGRNRSGSVLSCYSAGTLAADLFAGGVVGENSGSVSCCYSTVSVTGDSYVGGLVGHSSGSISKCYSAGAVTGSRYVGGLVGNGLASVMRSCWDEDASGIAYSSGGAGLTTEEMMNPEWIGLQGWGNDPNWVLDAHRDYPRLVWEGTIGQVVPAPIIDWMAGEGTSEKPYEINDPNQLLVISKASQFWQQDFVLNGDLNLETFHWHQGVFPSFIGTFDGAGHMIENLRLSGANCLGFFGLLDEGGYVLNLHLSGAKIVGTGECVGSVVGSNRGELSTCSSDGEVTGHDYVGGLVGHNTGTVSSGYSAAQIRGGSCIGGLTGYNRGQLSNCYSTGLVVGDSSAGGLLGCNDGLVSHSYSAGAVRGPSYSVGGLVAYSKYGADISCFWNIETSGQSDSDGGTGLTTGEMQTAATFLEVGWDFVGEVENGTEEIWWIEEGADTPRLWWERDEVSL